MSASGLKLLRFLDENGSDIIIYAESIFMFEAIDKSIRTKISCNFFGEVRKYELDINTESLINQLHQNDDFKVIEIKPYGDLTDEDINELLKEI